MFTLTCTRLHFERNISLPRDYIVRITLFKWTSFVHNLVLADRKDGVVQKPVYFSLSPMIYESTTDRVSQGYLID